MTELPAILKLHRPSISQHCVKALPATESHNEYQASMMEVRSNHPFEGVEIMKSNLFVFPGAGGCPHYFLMLLAQKSLSAVCMPSVLSSPVTMTWSPFSIPSILTAGLSVLSSSTIKSYHTCPCPHQNLTQSTDNKVGLTNLPFRRL